MANFSQEWRMRGESATKMRKSLAPLADSGHLNHRLASGSSLTNFPGIVASQHGCIVSAGATPAHLRTTCTSRLVWHHRRRRELLLGEAVLSSRETNLAAAWRIVHEHGLSKYRFVIRHSRPIGVRGW